MDGATNPAVTRMPIATSSTPQSNTLESNAGAGLLVEFAMATTFMKH